MRFIDLFAGLGGFHLAASELGTECVFASEIDPKLREIYEMNFGIEPRGDIREVDPNDIPEHDILCAGFPCQPFSKAGEQQGWQDAVRGTLFNQIIEILNQHKPVYILLENVANFEFHDNGNTNRRVKEALTSLGYSIKSARLSPHQFGVPQIRERFFIVGKLGGLDQFDWPDVQTNLSDLSIYDVIDKHPGSATPISTQVENSLHTWQDFLVTFPPSKKLPSFPIWSMEFGATYPYDMGSLFKLDMKELRKYKGNFGEGLNYRFRKEVFEKLPSHSKRMRNSFPGWKQRFIQQNRELYEDNKSWIDKWLPKIKAFPSSLQKFEWNCQGEERDIWKYVIQFRASGVRVKRPTTSPSLVAMTTTQVPIIAWEKRYMTVNEAKKLQSMESLIYMPNGGSAYKALGNAVNVRVVKLILEKLLN